MRARSRNLFLSSGALQAVLIFVVVIAALLFRTQLFGVFASLAVWFVPAPPEAYASLPKEVLASRLADVEEELNRIRYQSLLYTEAVLEQNRLERELSLVPQATSGVGRVVSRPPKTPYDTLVVEVPSGHRVREGERALVHGVLVGEVTRVTGSNVQVSLLSSGGTAFDTRVGEPSAIVTLLGLGGGSFTFEVPISVVVVPGDIIRDAAHGHPVAVVRAVQVRQEQTVQTVVASTPISFSDMVYVSFLADSE